MVLTEKGFKEKFLKYLSSKFDSVSEESGSFNISKDNAWIQIEININSLYKKYMLENKYAEIFKDELKIIKDTMKNEEIDLESIYPLIKHASCRNQYNKNIYKNIFLDLDVYYVIDKGDRWKYVPVACKYDADTLHEHEIENISKKKIALDNVDYYHEIYSFNTEDSTGISSFLSDSIQLEVLSKLGKDFLLIVPENHAILLTPYRLDIVSTFKNICDEFYTKDHFTA